MSASLSLTETNILTALRSFLLGVLPAGVQVVQGQDNRSPEPLGDFITMTPILRERLATNNDDDQDAVFTGSIAGATMTITAVHRGALAVGSTVLGVNVTAGTTITAFGTGTGGVGTYTVAPPQTVTSETLAAGEHEALSPVKLTVRCFVQGASSTDNAQIIAGLFRDSYACEAFAASGFDLQPLYSEDPRQTPFINAEGQYETQWAVDVVMQANPIISTPQQFAATLAIDLIDVDAVYPP
jgi:hypothetical protein